MRKKNGVNSATGENLFSSRLRGTGRRLYSHVFGRAMPDHAGACPGACPYRVQCRIERRVKPEGVKPEGQVKYRTSHVFRRARRDHTGACPYRVQCRIARCDMRLRHKSHIDFPQIFAAERWLCLRNQDPDQRDACRPRRVCRRQHNRLRSVSTNYTCGAGELSGPPAGRRSSRTVSLLTRRSSTSS
jgi:hypothetical protein